MDSRMNSRTDSARILPTSFRVWTHGGPHGRRTDLHTDSCQNEHGFCTDSARISPQMSRKHWKMNDLASKRGARIWRTDSDRIQHGVRTENGTVNTKIKVSAGILNERDARSDSAKIAPLISA